MIRRAGPKHEARHARADGRPVFQRGAFWYFVDTTRPAELWVSTTSINSAAPTTSPLQPTEA